MTEVHAHELHSTEGKPRTQTEMQKQDKSKKGSSRTNKGGDGKAGKECGKGRRALRSPAVDKKGKRAPNMTISGDTSRKGGGNPPEYWMKGGKARVTSTGKPITGPLQT